MNYNFFADEADKIEILNFIFNETDLQVFDSYSTPGTKVSQYQNTAEMTTKFDLVNGGSYALTFQLWSPEFKVSPIFKRIELNPKYVKGETFRYATEGWGLIQLYFGGLEQTNFGGITETRLYKSHIGHFNQKGAMALESINLSNGKADQCNWKEVEKVSRQLKYHIHNRLSIKKIGAVGILKGAEILERSGVIFAQ